MKIFRTALAVLLLGAAVVPVLVHAREINSNPAKQDAVSFHGGDPTCYSAGYVSGCEVAVDVIGNFLPTVTNVQTLGTPSLVWSNVYSQAATVLGNDASGTAGTTPASGVGGTAASQSSVLGLQVFGKTMAGTNANGNFGLYVSSIVPVNSSYITVISSGLAIKLTSTPNISTTTVVGGSTEIPSGTFLIISSTDATDTVTFQDAGTLTGSQLQLGAATRTVAQYKTLTLIYDAADHFWREVAYGNN